MKTKYQMEISLVIYPNTFSTNIRWIAIPRINEYVFINSKKYKVTEIYHNIDEDVIRVLIMPV